MVDSVPFDEIPSRPRTVTRDAARNEKARRLVFEAALRSAARASRWRVAQGIMFREVDGWFAQIHAGLGWRRGAVLFWSTKPMALDSLFWDITGSPQYNSMPLSFRAVGAWCLRPIQSRCGTVPDLGAPEALAEAVVAWADEGLARSDFVSSVEAMLAAWTRHALPGHTSALEICLRILDGDLAGASRICRDAEQDAGGFSTLTEGVMVSFVDRAKAWIAARQGA